MRGRNMENLSLLDIAPTNLSSFQNWNKMILYWKLGYGFSFFLIIISVITVAANALLLLVLYKDPLKRFRTPLCNILVSLSLSDLVAGLTYEPISAVCYFMAYSSHPNTRQCLYYVKSYLSAVTRAIWKISPLHILALTVLQFIVIASPLKLTRSVTKKNTILVVAFIWLYSTVFEGIVSSLPESSREYVDATITDITIHNLCIPSITLLIYILLYREFKHRATEGLVIHSESVEQTNKEKRRLRCQQKLLKMNLLLVVVLLLCTLPYGWTQMAYLLFGLRAAEFQFIPLATFSLKLMLHTTVFAWRMPQYRLAFRVVLCRKCTFCGAKVRRKRYHVSIGTNKLAKASSKLSVMTSV